MALPRLTIALLLLCSLEAPAARSQAASEIAEDERIVLFPTSASWEGDVWRVPIHGWVFEPEEGDLARRPTIALFRGILGLVDDDPVSEIFERRLRGFLVDNERGKRVGLKVGDLNQTLSASGPDGHFDDVLELQAGASWLTLTAAASGDSQTFEGRVRLLEPEGLTILSDIDDTVKVSNVRDRQSLLRNTFLRDFEAVPGMAARYNEWHSDRGAHVHFVSSSPWQLYEELSEFLRREDFPESTLSLKHVRLKDSSALNLLDDPLEAKTSTIEAFIRRFPDREFVLVGDSGEMDPEVYGEIARRHPGRVLRIFIRDVSGEDPGAARYRAAFEGVPERKWELFDDGSTLTLP